MNNSPRPEEAIVDAALALSAGERTSYVENACGSDTRLRELVDALLRAHDRALAAVRTRDPALQSDSLRPPESPVVAEKPGTVIGRYRILEQVGEGGFGVVYVAEQREPVKRRVALKIIKLGMDTRQVVARFEAERQALALMDHPNIARVLDAGATETGRPYFVMELVRGIRITDYCDQNNLPTDQRLKLFTQICRAIQHAHQKGIIHRDIKPSNILVTLHDGTPMPKVIDFGIAKATQQELTDKTLYTALQQFVGTPAYMSPEQAEMSGLDIDTRSDIYSLGVLLYELLTGQMPFDPKRLVTAGLDEMRRVIREEEPLRPSTRISTLSAEEQTTVARRRQAEATKLISEVRGDLDWIVMKCLEKDRTRRYETATALADDLLRTLTQEPVTARPPSVSYRLGKLIRRNKLIFGAASAVLLALMIGLGLSTVLFFRERTTRKRAVSAEADQRVLRQEAEREGRVAKENEAEARAVLEFFLKHILMIARPEGVEGAIKKDVTIGDALAAAEPAISTAFSNHPLVEASVRNTLGQTYYFRGDYIAATQQLGRVVDLLRTNRGLKDPETLSALGELGKAYGGSGHLDTWLALAREAATGLEAALPASDPRTIQALHDLGWAYEENGEYDRSIKFLEKAAKLGKENLGAENDATLASLEGLAMVYGHARRWESAAPILEEALRIRRKQDGSEDANTIATAGNLANAYQHLSRFGDALPLREEVLRFRKKSYGLDAPQTLISMNNMAALYFDMGKLADAIELDEEVLRLRRAKLGNEHPDTVLSMHQLAIAYSVAHRNSEALPLYQEAVRWRQAHLGLDHPYTLSSMMGEAVTLRDLGQYSNAIPIAEQVLNQTTNKLGPAHPDAIVDANNLASIYQLAGRAMDAESLLQTWLTNYAKAAPEDALKVMLRCRLGCLLVEQQRLREAEPVLAEACERMIEIKDRIPSSVRPRFQQAATNYLAVLETVNRQAKAAEWKARLAPIVEETRR